VVKKIVRRPFTTQVDARSIFQDGVGDLFDRGGQLGAWAILFAAPEQPPAQGQPVVELGIGEVGAVDVAESNVDSHGSTPVEFLGGFGLYSEKKRKMKKYIGYHNYDFLF